MIACAWIGIAGLALVGCGGEAVMDGDAGGGGDAATADVGTAPTDAPSASDTGPLDAGPLRMAPLLPSATGTCPDLTTTGAVTVSPTGVAPREVRIWVGEAAAESDGPLVFFWHGAGGSPTEATYALGAAVEEITAAGGIVVAPVHDPEAGTFPWFLTAGGMREDDLVIADEVVACAESSIGIDEHHIHAVGFSAGAMQTVQMSFRRASYVASVVSYSGGLVNARMPRTDAPDARFAAMILFGGERDEVVINFATASRSYLDVLSRGPGYFGLLCDHGAHGAVCRDSARVALPPGPPVRHASARIRRGPAGGLLRSLLALKTSVPDLGRFQRRQSGHGRVTGSPAPRAGTECSILLSTPESDQWQVGFTHIPRTAAATSGSSSLAATLAASPFVRRSQT
jgi:predicted esterase